MGALPHCVIFACIVASVLGQRSVPVFEAASVASINNQYFAEDRFTTGDIVATVVAVDPDGTSISYFLLGDGGEYFSIGRESGVIKLKKELDFETDPEIRMTIKVVDGDAQSSVVDVKNFVNDENDNEPEFSDYAIALVLSEDVKVGTVVTGITVRDLDTNNAQITVTCTESTELFTDACSKFGLDYKPVDVSNKFWKGELYVKDFVDYEERKSYAVLLSTFDGKYTVTNEVHIILEDVNDSPPRFIQASPKVINEEEPIQTTIETVIAIDQDETNSSAIRYELVGANTDWFQIHDVTGDISNRQRLDYDNTMFPREKPFDVTIKAREVLPDGSLGNDAITTATVNILITVLDINDNTPTFEKDVYEVDLDENIATRANIPGLQMTVEDIDSGTFNSFDLVTLSYQDVFQITPNEDSASASATLFVIDGSKIDYESGPREYEVVVEARQTKVNNPQRTGTTTVKITVKDVNDETPKFDAETYTRYVSELAPGGFTVINLDATDREEGDKGTAGIIYQLYGNKPAHFTIDPETGVVKVAPCATPGRDGCIDYERKKRYSLTVSATDNKGAQDSRSHSVQLIIIIEDENDNVPAVEKSYSRYIEEGKTVTINPLRIDVTDPDEKGGPITFSIIGDTSGLWEVTPTKDPITNNMYGNITASRAILYEDAPDQIHGEKLPFPRFNFRVEVDDGKYQSGSDVTINVLDINNNAPIFTAPEFIQSIPEDTLGDKYVITVTATDGDAPSTGNGVLDITIGTGGRGKFYAKETKQRGNKQEFMADIYTTSEAKFNFETNEQYDMELIVRDRGTPASKQGTGKLTVKILDINNKDPIIRPPYQSITVVENTPIGRSVVQISATDADDNRDLRFSFIASSATDGNGAPVDYNKYDFRKLFRMESMTGKVFVDSALDRDSAASITYDLLVEDVAARPVQTGTGILLIRVTEFNDQAPQFNSSQYVISIKEELNINSFIQNLYCTDDDDKIEGYSLVQTKPRTPTFFSFYALSGAMLVDNRIDYDRPNNIKEIELTAYCTDTGVPQLTATTKITVKVININDNYPVFSRRQYTAVIPEGSNSGVLGVSISATDQDDGDYGVVRYRLLPSNSGYDHFFEIDPISAQITILPTASFDREETGYIGLNVEAYDSPNDASVRLNTAVPVYITITDINDNCPIFSQPNGYNGTVPESAEQDSSVMDIIATDLDEFIFAKLAFTFKAGTGSPPETENLFSVGRSNGRINVRNSLRGKVGLYSFTLVATDNDGVGCATEVPVYIQIQESLNKAPRWIRPPRRNFEIYVLESQYEGMLVYNAKAVDDNEGESGVVDYYFIDRDTLTHKTPEFRINRVTGVIRAEVEFDRETQDYYFLTLLAKDRGNPAASSETTLTVIILDVDDNDPSFAKNGAVEPLYLPEDGIVIRDNAPVSSEVYLGKCHADDADLDTVYYDILAADAEVRSYIRIESETCRMYLTKAVDYETHPTLEFDILAYNKKNDDSVKRYKREANPSIQHVIVNIQDTNDNGPVFKQNLYLGCVSDDAPFNKTILEVQATDLDSSDNSRIKYTLDANSRNLGFAIEPTVGSLYNIKTLINSRNSQFDLIVYASDGKNEAQAAIKIFVTSQSNVVKVKVNRPLNDVQPFSQQMINSLTNSDNPALGFACVERMRNHLDDDGDEILTATDVFMAGAKKTGTNQYEMYPADELADKFNSGISAKDTRYTSIFVEAEAESDDDDFDLEEDAVLAVLIIAILLVIMALILVCVACYCIRKKDKKKKRKIQASRHSALQPVQEAAVMSVNPAYDRSMDQPYESEYATVKKVRPAFAPIAPVSIPVPEHLEPVYTPPPPQYLMPAEPEEDEPVPVIETEVMPEYDVDTKPYYPPPPQDIPTNFQPEYEDRIETEVVDDPKSLLPPPVLDDHAIDVVIDDTIDVRHYHSS